MYIYTNVNKDITIIIRISFSVTLSSSTAEGILQKSLIKKLVKKVRNLTNEFAILDEKVNGPTTIFEINECSSNHTINLHKVLTILLICFKIIYR